MLLHVIREIQIYYELFLDRIKFYLFLKKV